MPAINIPGLPAIDLASKTIRSSSKVEPILAARADDSSSTTFVAIPSTYGALDSSPSPGVVAGIVLGSVAAFLLLLYVIYCILHGGLVLIPIRSGGGAKSSRQAPSTLGTSTLGTSTLGTSTYGTRTVMSFRSSRRDSKRRRQSRSPRPAEVVQVRKTSTTTKRRTVEPVIVSPPRSPSPVSTAPPPRAVPTSEISGVSSMDEIVVEEENSSRSRSRSSRSRSPPRRHASRRYSPERGGYRRDSYYRDEVDSERYYSQRDSPGRRPGRRY